METLDIEIIKPLFQELHPLLNITFCAHDKNGFPILGYPEQNKDNFCYCVQRHPSLFHECCMSDQISVNECLNHQFTYIYTCHMGLTEMIIPVRNKNFIVGYIRCGQFVVEKNIETVKHETEKYEKLYNIKSGYLSDKISNIPILSESQVISAKRILELIASYTAQNTNTYTSQYNLPYEINSYIESHITENYPISELAKRFNISQSTLYNISKKHFNCSIKEYIITRKLVRAKSHLINGHSVESSAEYVGFDDTNYFIRIFKAKNGITPKQFQVNYKTKKS